MRRSIGMGATMLLLLAGCATGPGATRATVRATLNGLQEVPGPGDPDGTGTAEVRVDAGGPRLCWELFARGIDPATAAHIHRGAEGTAGPPVVTLTTPDAAGSSSGCAALDEGLAREIAAGPHNFYVNVHNAAFPAGAIRGQLRGAIRPQAGAGY
jgi:hypothetical protein